MPAAKRSSLRLPPSGMPLCLWHSVVSRDQYHLQRDRTLNADRHILSWLYNLSPLAVPLVCAGGEKAKDRSGHRWPFWFSKRTTCQTRAKEKVALQLAFFVMTSGCGATHTHGQTGTVWAECQPFKQLTARAVQVRFGLFGHPQPEACSADRYMVGDQIRC